MRAVRQALEGADGSEFHDNAQAGPGPTPTLQSTPRPVYEVPQEV